MTTYTIKCVQKASLTSKENCWWECWALLAEREYLSLLETCFICTVVMFFKIIIMFTFLSVSKAVTINFVKLFIDSGLDPR